MTSFPLLLSWLLALLLGGGEERDADGDGLSDFAELHKHLTDPAKRDSDGDGKPDGDWDERREYAYTVRSVMRLLPPCSEAALTDDQQDGRVLRTTKEFVEIEVVHYPLNTAGAAIVGDAGWRKQVAARPELKPFLQPGPCVNFDAAMGKALSAELAKRGVEVAKADDKTLAEACARWLLEATQYHDGFTTFCIDVSGKKPRVQPGLEQRIEAELARTGKTLEEECARELFAKSMFEQRVRGSCTSSAILWCGALRSLGLPTRLVLAVPLVDASDKEELGWLAKLEHDGVRKTVTQALAPLAGSWSSHTMVEVFVGGRWRLLNYGKLGQPSLDAGYFGLMTHVATLRDWADGEVHSSIGLRQCGEKRADDDPFGHANPYSCVELSDQFGAHAQVANPEAPEHRALTITKAYWWSSPDRRVDMKLDEPATSGHFLVRVAERFPGEDQSQYTSFYGAIDRDFVLRADGHGDVIAKADRGWFLESDGAHFYVRIAPAEVAKMAIGVPYRLVARNGNAGWSWKVAEGVTLTRTEASTPFAVADGPPIELPLDELRWSDDAALPEFMRKDLRGRAGPPALLARCVGWKSFDEIKRITSLGDGRFFLEAEGLPPLGLVADPARYSQREKGVDIAWIVLPLGGGDWRDLVAGASYKLRARNDSPRYRWAIKEGLAITRAAK